MNSTTRIRARIVIVALVFLGSFFVEFSPSAHAQALPIPLQWGSACKEARNVLNAETASTTRAKTTFSRNQSNAKTRLQAQIAKKKASAELLKTRELAKAATIKQPAGFSAMINYGADREMRDRSESILNNAERWFADAHYRAYQSYWNSLDVAQASFDNKIIVAQATFSSSSIATYDEALRRLGVANEKIGIACNRSPQSTTVLASAHTYVQGVRGYTSIRITALQKRHDTTVASALQSLQSSRKMINQRLNTAIKAATELFVGQVGSGGSFSVRWYTPPAPGFQSGRDPLEDPIAQGARDRLVSAYYALIGPAEARDAQGYIAGIGVIMSEYANFVRSVSLSEVLDGLGRSSSPYIQLFDPQTRTDRIYDVRIPAERAVVARGISDVWTRMPEFFEDMARIYHDISKDPVEARKAISFMVVGGVLPEEELVVSLPGQVDPNHSGPWWSVSRRADEVRQRDRGGQYDDWVGNSDWSWTCFDGDTLVLMADGAEKPIKDVVVGDKVASFTETGERVHGVVTEVISHGIDRLLRVNGAVLVTPEHKFLTSEGGFVPIGRLKAGDYLVDADGLPVRIETIEQLQGELTVYNLEIADTHTYIAGGYRVHNRK